MATTTNYGWTTPDDTALVKDGAAAIRTLGSSIDSTLKTQIDAQIPDSLLTTKGDLIAATGASTPARLGVGTNNQVLMADSTAATGMKWDTPSAGGWTSLASGSLSGTEVTMSSISGVYRDLRLVIISPAQNSGSNEIISIRINGSTGSNYSSLSINYNSSTWNTFSNTATSFVGFLPTGSAGTSQNVITFPEYSRSNVFKSWNFENTGSNRNYGYGNNISVTSAITSVTILNNAGVAFTAGTYELYGAK